MHVFVCALTFHRPLGLQRLLDHLADLERPAGVDVSVVIVDNDPDESGRSTVERAAAAFPVPLEYRCQPVRGIWAGRNMAVATSLAAGADAVCFIDDDEWPEPNWLTELVALQRSTDADVVTGPVFPVFDEDPPDWVIAGGFFDRRSHEHGERLHYATTSSVLILRRCFDRRPEPFDRRFGLSGGDDTHFFAELDHEGYAIRWCESAHVSEAIPATRVNRTWLLRREYRRGQTLSLSLRIIDPRPLRYAKRMAHVASRLGRGAATLVVGIVRGRAVRLQGAQNIAFGAGLFTGLLGRRYDEYRTVHGA